METDRFIIARILRGETIAYAQLIERHRPRCFRYACRMLGDHDEAEDVVQEAFVRAYRALSQCVNPDRFGEWVFQILVNRCRTAIERRTTQDRWFVRTDTDILDPRSDISQQMPQTDDVEYALAQLAPVYREALILKYVEQLTYDEMAEITGIGISALKMRVNRAGAMLRSRLLNIVKREENYECTQ